MTRDEILAMKPGPGLSALVGEHVINECRHDFERCGPNFWNYQCRKCGMEDSNFVKKLHVVGENKPYSTDIAAAWEVWEHETPENWRMTIHKSNGRYLALIVEETKEKGHRTVAQVEAKTAAEAMVKCRLLAVMEE